MGQARIASGDKKSALMNTPKRVLVIDDERMTARLVSGILTRQGYETQIAASVSEALDLLGKQSFQLITCDLMLPEISGLDFLKMMKNGMVQPKVPMMLITGLVNADSLAEARKLGVVNVLNKPFTPQQLIDAAATVLKSE